jgi:hypothetical protein
MKAFLFLCFFVLGISPVWANETYDKTLEGKSCQEDTRQQINCTYKIGEDLEIWIDGIGLPDTGVTFAKSNFQGDYYAAFGMQHLCVMVKSGKDLLQGLAFISPKNGKVYKDWETCQKAK